MKHILYTSYSSRARLYYYKCDTQFTIINGYKSKTLVARFIFYNYLIKYILYYYIYWSVLVAAGTTSFRAVSGFDFCDLFLYRRVQSFYDRPAVTHNNINGIYIGSNGR